ncbi:beta-galactosidase [Striga asiatica]|uniref:Beta-galactosidase n=1 Tax=Striga asiatica TaxID=4170 RepID=A0A5A7P383_STRAF|nr:beta-galactosidase [Striga asiatica]
MLLGDGEVHVQDVQAHGPGLDGLQGPPESVLDDYPNLLLVHRRQKRPEHLGQGLSCLIQIPADGDPERRPAAEFVSAYESEVDFEMGEHRDPRRIAAAAEFGSHQLRGVPGGFGFGFPIIHLTILQTPQPISFDSFSPSSLQGSPLEKIHEAVAVVTNLFPD